LVLAFETLFLSLSPEQQSQSSQHETALPDASFFFIGQESPLQQAHEIDVPVVFTYAKVALPIPKTSSAAIARIVCFFI